MIDKILSIIQNHPRHYSSMISRDPDLRSWVLDRSDDSCVSFAERIYQSLHGTVEATCLQGRRKTWAGINLGYRFCGRAADCDCARQAVSSNVSAAGSTRTAAERTKISEKRRDTNLARYGHINTAQTILARSCHREFYADPNNVDSVNQQSSATKLRKHGDPTYNNSAKIRQTWAHKVAEGHFYTKYPNIRFDILRDPVELRRLYESQTIDQIAEIVSAHAQTVYKYLNVHGIRSPYSSAGEQDIVNYLTELGVSNIVRRSRKLLTSGKELDIYLPDHALAIEFNGIYWHHNDIAHISRDYHQMKYQEARQQGIQLLSVFSDHWELRKPQVKQLIRHKLGLGLWTCGARQCQVSEISVDHAREFLDRIHIQGYVGATTRLGLFYSDRLVAVMLFGKPRTGAGQGSHSEHSELLRFSVDGSVPGAAGKLLSYYIKNHHPSSVISFSDNEWSHGDLYQSLGFKLNSEIKPSYWYVTPRDGKRLHRYNFAKHKLVAAGYDPSMTEREITRDLGLMRVWDCGKKKWILSGILS